MRRIDADELKKKLEAEHCDCEVIQIIDDMPTAEEKTAHWDICCDGYYPFCSHCGEAAEHMTPHCPNCGRKMITRGHES